MGNVFGGRECVTIDTYHNILPDPHSIFVSLMMDRCLVRIHGVAEKLSWNSNLIGSTKCTSLLIWNL